MEEDYEEQLRQMNEAIKLKNDLQALLELTIQNENGNSSSSNESSSNIVTTATVDATTPDPLADEMALFMSEIGNIEKRTGKAKQCPDDDDETFQLHMEAIKAELQSMIGKKCSAPHEHTWGTKNYHNAIICGLDDTNNYNLNEINKFRLRILFTNPTHREMIPCSYFLEGECRFDVEKCRFSHGELVPVGDLKDYQKPDFKKLQRNCVVLAKMKDKLWHKGRVLCVDIEKKSCRVRLDHHKKEIDFQFEDLFPIFHDDDLSSGSSSDSEDSDKNEIDYFEEARKARLVEQSLLNPAPNQALGEWEKHTKGIGSKLMQQMGYVIGTGLGSNGKGIIIPISAQILPPGRSLDHCMELRESANGDQNLFSVERKMKSAQRKHETLSAKAYQRETNKTDLFSFLNENILTYSPSNPKIPKLNHNNNNKLQNYDYKNQTTKNLNVQSVKIADDIRKMEREILKLKESLKRQTNGTELYKRIEKTLKLNMNELEILKKSESLLTKEQVSRKHKEKLSIF